MVMPVKGVKEESLQNWATQLTTGYGGELEYLFCVESEDDPAVRAVGGAEAVWVWWLIRKTC